MDNKLGELISELRKKKNLTQEELASLLFVSNKAISRWERGHSLPDIDKLLLISQIFEVNLNDLITLRTASSKNSEELVKEMIQEFSEANKKNAKKIRIILLFALFVVTILIISIIFINSYNRFKVYKVDYSNNDFYSINGMYVETRIRDSLNLGEIKIKDYIPNENDTISVDLYVNENKQEKVLYTFSTLDRIIFNGSQSYIKIDDLSDFFDKLYLKVTIIDEKNNIKEFKSKLNFTLDFSNNKIFTKNSVGENINYETYRINRDNLFIILLNNGFEVIHDNIFIKNENNFSITYFQDTNKINYTYEKYDYSYRYNYALYSNELEVQIFDKDNTEISNYIYNSKKDKVIECYVGKCNDYKEAMGILNKNILNLLKEK